MPAIDVRCATEGSATLILPAGCFAFSKPRMMACAMLPPPIKPIVKLRLIMLLPVPVAEVTWVSKFMPQSLTYSQARLLCGVTQ